MGLTPINPADATVGDTIQMCDSQPVVGVVKSIQVGRVWANPDKPPSKQKSYSFEVEWGWMSVNWDGDKIWGPPLYRINP